MFEDGRSFRHDVKLRRYGFNPTFAVQFSPETRLDLGYEYFHDRRTTDRGVPAEFDRPLKGFDKTFFGDPRHSFARADVNIGSAAIEHELRRRPDPAQPHQRRALRQILPEHLSQSNLDEATREVVLGAYNSRNDRTNAFNQTDLIRTGTDRRRRPDFAVRGRAWPPMVAQQARCRARSSAATGFR